MADYMPAGKFKAKCLMLMDQVKKYGQTVTITKHGKPVARLVPAEIEEEKKGSSPFGLLKDTFETQGNILEPIDDIWNVEKRTEG